MKTKKKQGDADFIYLVKIARTKKALESSNPIPCVTWTFWDKNYRVKKSGVAISIFSSEEEAQKAIDREQVMLKRESEQFKRDVCIIKCNDMGKRYPGILDYMYARTNPYVVGKPPVFKIVRTGADTWRKLWS